MSYFNSDALPLADFQPLSRPKNQSMINGGLQIWSFIVSLGFAFAVDKIGRRQLFLIAGVGMLVSFTTWTA